MAWIYSPESAASALRSNPGCECAEATPVPCTVLDPFAGAFTTGLVADRLGRHAIGIELNPAYVAMAKRRLAQDAPLFHTEANEGAP